MGPPRWAEPYVAVPYLDGGRDMAGADCWGLTRLVLAARAGIALPSYGEIEASDVRRVARAMGSDSDDPPWLAVSTPRALDVVVMKATAKVGGRERDMLIHVGVMLDDRHVLHTEEGSGPDIVAIDARAIRSRIAGFRRHEALA